MARTKSRFVCQECSYVASSWLGRCPECGGWNTLVEEAEVTAKASKSYLPANNEKLRAYYRQCCPNEGRTPSNRHP